MTQQNNASNTELEDWLNNLELSDNLKWNYGDGHGSVANKLGHLLDKETMQRLLAKFEERDRLAKVCILTWVIKHQQLVGHKKAYADFKNELAQLSRLSKGEDDE